MSGTDHDAADAAETGTTAAERDAADGKPPEVPVWDDEYVEAVSRRLLHNYDLEKDRTVRGEHFDLYGLMELLSKKHMFHPALSFAHHESTEHLFLRRVERATPGEIDRLVELGHALGDAWVDPDEEHFSTEFTFVLVAPEVTDDLRDRVAAVDERTLLKYGYHGHYDVHAAVVAPDDETIVASDAVDVEEALRLWEPIEREEVGLLGLIARRLQI